MATANAGGEVQVTNRKVPYRYIEWHLYNYHENKRLVALERGRIIHAAGLSHAELQAKIQSSYIENPTERKGMELADRRWLNRMQGELESVDRALARLSEDCRLIVARRYWSGTHGDRETARCLYMSGPKYRRLKKRVIYTIAEEMGMLPVVDLSAAE